jgi:DNA-binding LytR/AlgR family response regulator
VELGMQVHRSSWIAKAHTVKVHMAGAEAYCVMTNGLKVPVSRNKRKEVKNYFGQFVRHTAVVTAPVLSRVK